MHIHTVGIDIAKTVSHLVAVDEKGSVVVKKKVWLVIAGTRCNSCSAAVRQPSI